MKARPAPQTRDVRAEAAGTNPRYIDLADRLVDERPDLVADIEADLAAGLSKRETGKRNRVSAMTVIRVARRAAERAARVAQLEAGGDR